MQRLSPPRGCDVRRMTAFMMLAIRLPRLGIGDLVIRFATLHLMPTELYGMLFVILGVLMLATCSRRLVWQGRLVAVFSFGGFATLIVDSISVSTVSALIGEVVAYAILGEVTAHD